MNHNFVIICQLKKIWPFFKLKQSALAMAVIATIIGSLTEPLIPALLQPLLDNGFIGGDFNLWAVPAAVIMLFGVRGLAGFIAQCTLSIFTNSGLFELREAMFRKLLTSGMSLFSMQSASTLTNTVVYEVHNGSTLLSNAFIGLIKDSFTLLALIGYLLFLNWQLTFIVALMFPAVALVMRTLSIRLFRLTKTSQTATDNLAYVVEENVLAHRDIRLHAAQALQQERFSNLSHSLQRLSVKSSIASAAMTPMTQMLAAMALSAVISMALVQSKGDTHSVGSFVAFVTAMLMLIAPIKHLSEVASPITRGLAALERGLNLLESTPSETGGDFSVSRCLGNLRFNHVTVSFAPDGPPAVKNLSLVIDAGETIALVGASGAGKTTLINLLPRFLDPKEGSITLDNIELKDWRLDSLRRQFAVVSQHVYLLSGSIAFNVALGQAIDRLRVAECLRAANLESMVNEMPLGMDSEVGHNAMQLSGGQRQRLAIARALYKDAPILVLDEATSALDTESERAVQDALEHLMRNRTTLVIAHRLSTVQRASRIVVMDAGQIVEIGTHESLLQSNGYYARLYQFSNGADPNEFPTVGIGAGLDSPDPLGRC